MPRLRYLLARYPALYWGPAVVVAVAVGWLATVVVDRATADVRALGPWVDVPVAARAVEAGEVLGAGDVAWRRLPSGVLPEGGEAFPGDPTGRTTLVPLVRGEVVLRSNVAPEGLRGLAALVPVGMQAVPVPVAVPVPGLRRGDRVDVLVVGEGEAAEVVAVGALVLEPGDDAVVVAVAAEEAPVVASAAAGSVVVLALVPPQP